MDIALNYFEWALLAPFYWTHLARRNHSDRTTNKYLQSLTETSLLSTFGEILRPLTQEAHHIQLIFDKFAVSGDRDETVWSGESFDHFVHAASGGVLGESSITQPLWRCFSRAAYFPLNPPQCASYSAEVDLDAFHRACALLVIQGIQLPGFDVYYGCQSPHKLQRKMPRIAGFIMSCMARCREGEESDDDDEDEKGDLEEEETTAGTEGDLTEKNVLDIVNFAQPSHYQQPFSDLAEVPGIPPRAFREAAERLASSARRYPNYVSIPPTLLRQDFYALLRSSMLVCLRDQRWRNGVTLPGSSDLISADVQLCRLNEDGSMADELASSLMDWIYPNSEEGSEGNISYSTFTSFCSDCPTFLLFFHLWATLFAPRPSPFQTTSGPQDLHSSIPIPLVNALSLLNAAKVDNHLASESRCFAVELQINLDFQAATLIFDASADRSPSAVPLRSVLSPGLGSYFHILIVQGEKFLIAIFIAPPDPSLEICRTRDGARYAYTWRYS